LKSLNKTLFLVCLFIYSFGYSQQPTDCIDAITVCGNSNVSLDVNGIGTQELSGSNTCSSQETNSIWLKVTTINTGTLAFTLTPDSNAITEDYDFFIFGPNVSCGNIGQAIRCSTTNPQAANQGNNLTGLSATALDTAEGPGVDGNSFVSAINVSAGDSYYIVIDRPVGNSPFSIDWTGTAQFSEPPVSAAFNANQITIENCDLTSPFDDGITSFNLEENTPTIIGGQNNVTITYHETESDANINTNALLSPYTNLTSPQTIYSRLTNTITNCYTIVPFELIIGTGPAINTPADYQVCDDASDGSNTNGQSFFYLPNKNTEIGGANTSDYTFSYHPTLIDASNNTNGLANNYYNTTPDLQTVFVRVENVSNPGCVSTIALNLIVNEAIITNNSSLFQCDEDGSIDGFTIFNLDEAFDDLTAGFPDRNIVFYPDAISALSQINAINSLGYSNISNPQTITAVVTNPNTNCFATATLTLEVSTTSISNYDAAPVCDDADSEDGLNTFNLNDFSADILIGLPAGLTINYYENYNDALLEQNQLPNNYTNTVPYNQTIYVRVEDDNACYGINQVTLTIIPLPQIEDDQTVLYCLNNFPETITLSTGNNDDALNNYTYSWNTGATTTSIDVNTIDSYTVTVTNSLGCSKVKTITVNPSNIATINDILVIDSTIDENQVTVLTSGEGDYEFELIDFLGESTGFQDSNVFNNIAPGFYTVNVKDVKNDCGAVNQQLSVIGFPLFFTPNNDGENDFWQIYGASNQFQPNSTIQIFDRYGKLLKEFTALNTGWDGTFNGLPMPTNDYWFIVKLEDGRVYKNHFTLKR
jgi:gliding motility-associated-like protein